MSINMIPTRSQILTHQEASIGLKNNKLWLCSHGGVGSEYLTKLLNITYSKQILPSAYRISAVIVHYHRPVTTGPEKAIFLFGDLYNSIYSQIKRHNMNPSKFANYITYPKIGNIKKFFEVAKVYKDPYNIFKMFQNFMTISTDYPLLLMKYNPSNDVIKHLKKFTNKKFNYTFKKRSSDFMKDATKKQIEKMNNIYGDLNWIMKEMPSIIIRYPIKTNYVLTEDDITHISTPVTSPEEMQNSLQNFFTFNNTNYIVHKSFDDKKLYLTKCTTPNKTIELYELDQNKNRKTVETNGGFTVCKFFRKVYVILNFEPLVAIKILDLKTGQSEFCTKEKTLPEKVDILSATPLQMWNHPNYIGFYVTPDDKVLKSFIFNGIDQTVKTKNVKFKLNNPNEFFTDIKVVGTSITAESQTKETKNNYKFEFNNFCKHFTL